MKEKTRCKSITKTNGSEMERDRDEIRRARKRARQGYRTGARKKTKKTRARKRAAKRKGRSIARTRNGEEWIGASRGWLDRKSRGVGTKQWEME